MLRTGSLCARICSAATIALRLSPRQRPPHLTWRSSGRRPASPVASAYLYVRCQVHQSCSSKDCTLVLCACGEVDLAASNTAAPSGLSSSLFSVAAVAGSLRRLPFIGGYGTPAQHAQVNLLRLRFGLPPQPYRSAFVRPEATHLRPLLMHLIRRYHCLAAQSVAAPDTPNLAVKRTSPGFAGRLRLPLR